jgi:hypothetical protein
MFNYQKHLDEIKNYMSDNYQDNVDNTCNVLNSTGLAEDVADHFNLYENDNIPEYVFDLAIEFEFEMIDAGLLNS